MVRSDLDALVLLWGISDTRVVELESRVNKKGQVTIPIELRKKYGIRAGMKMYVTESETGAIVLKPVLSVKDWAGADSGKYTYSDAVEKLDRLRRRWR